MTWTGRQRLRRPRRRRRPVARQPGLPHRLKTDEYLYANGITHLVEHLACSPLGHTPAYQVASVRTCITTFDTMGRRRSRVVAFLRRTCEALTHPSTRPGSRRSAGSLEVEARQRGAGPSSGVTRGGTAPPVVQGLWGWTVRRPQDDAEAVQAWRTTCSAPRTPLLMSGPPPAGLSLPLPHGARAAGALARRQCSPRRLRSSRPDGRWAGSPRSPQRGVASATPTCSRSGSSTGSGGPAVSYSPRSSTTGDATSATSSSSPTSTPTI